MLNFLYEGFVALTWQQVVMWIIGGVLIYLAIKKDMEPTLLLPMGFGAILVNLPLSGAVTQIYEGEAEDGERSPYLEANRQIPLDFDHLHIRHWRELGQLLREL
jgi:Na+-transporting methylmalonyl-CoA/oxaloacetate decarboxylase beta subunit